MKKLISLLAFALVASAAHAADEPLLDPGAVAGVHLGSVHSKRTYPVPGGARQFNNLNLGLYLRTAAGDTVGFYRNSINRTSVYLGRTLSWPVVPGVEVSVTAGVITGYQTGTMPFAVPSLRAGNVRLIFAPNLHGKDGAAVVSFAYEHQL